MQCSNCGQRIEQGSLVCLNCGTAVGASPQPSAVTPAAEPAPSASPAFRLKTPIAPESSSASFSGIHAGFLRRAAAYLLDALVLLVPNALLGMLGSFASLPQLIVWWLYKAGMESSSMQATLGKKALGIKVTGLDGERISFARASGRFFGSLVSAITLGIGYLMAAFTARRQALHDLMASCLVVRASATPEEAREGHGTMPMSFGAWVGAVVVLFVPLLGILAAIAIPAYQDYGLRAKMAEVIAEANRWKPEAAREFAAHARGEGAAQPVRVVAPTSPFVSRVVIRKPERRLELELEGTRFSTLMQPGAAVHFTLEANGDVWTCRGDGVPNKYLPAACRQ